MSEAIYTEPRTGADAPPPGKRRLKLLTSLGAVFTAFLASLCCVGPLVFALLGIGGAGLLVKMEPLRPFLSVATVALLGAGFYYTYRRPRAVEGDACGCEHPRANRTGRVLLWIATALAAAFLVFPYLTPIIFG